MLIGHSLAIDDEPSAGKVSYLVPYMLTHPAFAPMRDRARASGFAQVLKWDGQSHINIMGGFGVRFGDVVVGLQAAHVLRKRAGKPIHFHFHIVDDPAYNTAQVYELFDDASYDYLPLVASATPLIDADFCDVFYREAFQRLTLQDLFLDLMGIDWQTVNAADKKPNWLKGRAQPAEDCKDVIWLVPRSSDPLRTFSDHLIEQLLRLSPSIRLMPQSETFGDYVAKVAGGRALISTDTSAYHIAAAWDRPSCVVFGKTRIVQHGYEELHDVKAAQRIAYYPYAEGVEVPAQPVTPHEKEQYIVQAVRGWLRRHQYA